MRKRVVSIGLAVCLLLAAAWTGAPAAQGVETEAAYPYYEGQLSDTAAVFYDGLKYMLDTGMLKTGTQALDLADFGISQEQIRAHLNGEIDLLGEYAAGRDAFYMDYPDVFYVDFSNLTLRITKSGEHYHLYMGAGRYPTYYTEGFEDEAQVEAAIEAYDAALEAAVAAAGVSDDPAECVIAAHDYITHGTSYRMEDRCGDENIGFIRTAYGSLVRHVGVCEAYTRAMKAILDELNIPCVMVSGVYRHSQDVMEAHIWNAVQLDGAWYAVDATMDDPINYGVSEFGEDGYESSEYRLVGQDVMSLHHVESGYLSPGCPVEFAYPTLALKSYGMETAYSNGGLQVNFAPNGEREGEAGGIYYVSYKGMNVSEMREKGYYLLTKYYYEDPDTETWQYSDWCYAVPEIYDLEEREGESVFAVPHIQYMEFAITREPYGDYTQYDDPSQVEEYHNCITYHGADEDLLADSGMLYNPNGTYVAPPYIAHITPTVGDRLTIGNTYHVVAEYDDTLTLLDPEKPAGLTFSCESMRGLVGSTGEKYAVVEGFQWDEGNTVSFDFTPSKMWADDTIFYDFTLTNLVGARSGKVPNTISYLASYPCAAYAYKAQGFDFNVFGKPTLMDSSGFSTEDWRTDHGEAVSEKLTHRMMLVASSATEEQVDEMNGLLSGEGVQGASYYNIHLTLCKQMVVKTGDGVRVSLGFPDGYGPEDEGVTFKAYHFIHDEEGNITDVEEIPCVITRYGLVITCKSFSPFTVAAVERDGSEPGTKTLLIMQPENGGEITADRDGAAGNITLSEGETVEVTVRADEGYVIDTLCVGDRSVPVTPGQTELTVPVEYDGLEGTAGFVSAEFLAASVLKDEEGEGVGRVGVGEEAPPASDGGDETSGAPEESGSDETGDIPAENGNGETSGTPEGSGSDETNGTPEGNGSDETNGTPEGSGSEEAGGTQPAENGQKPEAPEGGTGGTPPAGRLGGEQGGGQETPPAAQSGETEAPDAAADEAPATGDESAMVLWLILMAAALAGVVLAIPVGVLPRRRRYHGKRYAK